MKHIFNFLVLLATTYVFGQAKYEQATTFYPENKNINEHDIEWGQFTVPENWNNPSKKIKLAVAILKNTTKNENADALVMIEGGPGASAVEGIWWWLNHPLRKTHDIVLMDARGTGFSEPRLCPELGKTFLNILAKNQSSNKDEQEKAEAALKCKQSLIAKNIDINSYHSKSIAQDIHALKQYLKYPKWNVYGVSYGTHIAQVYSETFPSDIKALILDSPISDISEYYTLNTSNYITSVEKVFKACKNNPKCNSEYPDLEAIYYKTIDDLKENPITVKVGKEIIPSGEFTYNSEDFKIAIHQALYQKKLVEVLPLLINQFYKKDKATLSALVAAFSGALSLDYGAYYCVTCNEAIPKNSIEDYNNDVKSQKSLSEGLSFYNSDFEVCKKWGMNNDSIIKLDTIDSQANNIPTLIFTGEFDPVTPSKNGKMLADKIEGAYLVEAPSFGHASSFSKKGFKIVESFINDPTNKVKNLFDASKTNFVNNIYVNGGISKIGNSLNNPDILFLLPLIIALLISLIAIFSYTFSILKKHKKINAIIRGMIVVSSILSLLIITYLIVGINNTASSNFYIVAFGLPENYSFVFKLLIPFIIILSLVLVLFFIGIKNIKNRSILFTVIFSNMLIATYLFYWGVFSWS